MILLANRSLIKLTGDDVKPFLQGMITNDIGKLGPQNAIYAALLTPQGKYLFDFIIYEIDGAVIVDIANTRASELVKRLSMYKLRSKVEIAAQPNLKVYADDKKGIADPRTEKLGKRLVTADDLPQNGNMDDYEHLRINLGVPDTADLIPDKSFIMQNNFEELHGVDFSKGCYVGQEVVARTKFRGNSGKKLYRVSSEHALENFGTPIVSGDKNIGEMRSSMGKIGIAQCDGTVVSGGGKFICGSNEVKLTEILNG